MDQIDYVLGIFKYACRLVTNFYCCTGVSTHAGVVLSVTCDVGYALGNGTVKSQIECMEDGEWNPPWNTVNCTKYICKEPPVIDHAIVKINSENTMVLMTIFSISNPHPESFLIY